MKVSPLLSLTALAATAVAEDAYLWTVDRGEVKYANTQASSISSDTASSILARRRGFLDESDLSSVSEGALRDIQQYGGFQIPLYGTTAPKPKKLLIRISGYTGTVSHFPSLPDLWIEHATKNLADDFKARNDVEDICEYNLKLPGKSGVDLVYAYHPEDSTCMSQRELQTNPNILALYSTVPTADNVPAKLSSLLRTLSHLSVTADFESTLLILPPTSKLDKTNPVRGVGPSEKLLDLEATSATATATATASTSSSLTSEPAKSTHTLPKIIPQCFSSKESCDNTTNSCSGHGSCYKAHNSCYKCKCGTTVVRENDDGTKKTVQWGGNACQKKDISTEFILFASIGVVLTALVAGAIGAMYTMGSQELPSVIGAGVTGPKAQK